MQQQHWCKSPSAWLVTVIQRKNLGIANSTAEYGLRKWAIHQNYPSNAAYLMLESNSLVLEKGETWKGVSLYFSFLLIYYLEIVQQQSNAMYSELLYTHTKPGGRLKWSYAKSPGWQPTLCVAWCLICWFALSYKKYGHTWHRMSLLRPGVIKQHKPNQTLDYKIFFVKNPYRSNEQTKNNLCFWSRIQNGEYHVTVIFFKQSRDCDIL